MDDGPSLLEVLGSLLSIPLGAWLAILGVFYFAGLIYERRKLGYWPSVRDANDVVKFIGNGVQLGCAFFLVALIILVPIGWLLYLVGAAREFPKVAALIAVVILARAIYVYAPRARKRDQPPTNEPP